MRLATVIEATPAGAERDRDALADLAGTDDEHVPFGERAEPIADHVDGGVADARRVTADRGLGAGPLAGLQRVAEQQVQRGSGRSSASACCHASRTWPRISDSPSTAESSPAATSNRWATASSSCCAVEVRVQVFGGEAAELAEEVADVGVGAVEALGDGVDLGAVAGR